MTCSRYILIGDVHGCLTELQALLGRIAPRLDDTLVFLGDLVDKGPESPAVVRWVRHLSTLYRVVLIEGNHEEKHRRWRQHMRLGSPVVHTMTGTQQIAAITQAMSADDIDFLETGQLPVFSANNPPGHARETGRKSFPGAGLRADAEVRSAH
jgi:predicted MPP superfamily phosphohydrolase